MSVKGLAPSFSWNTTITTHNAKMASKKSKETSKITQTSPRPARETPIPPPQPRMSRILPKVNVAIAEEDLNIEEARERDEKDAEHEVISFDEGANLARYGIVVTSPQKWDNMAGSVPEPGCWRCCVVSIDLPPHFHSPFRQGI
jgi:hypothetical protein